jgi:alpha-1,2-mannosyltransferase
VFYNVINRSKGGSELYGVEPWTYYFMNGFLNFNLLLPLALLSLPVHLTPMFTVLAQTLSM